MTELNPYIFRTNYFTREWTWIKRIIAIIILCIGVLILPLDNGFQFLKYLLVVLIMFYLIALPIDDLAINEHQLFHFRKSVVPKFTKVTTYDLSSVTSLRCGGIHSDKWELVDFFNGGNNMGGFSNIVEMSFQDQTSKSLELAISRDKLDKIVALAYELKKKSAFQNSGTNSANFAI